VLDEPGQGSLRRYRDKALNEGDYGDLGLNKDEALKTWPGAGTGLAALL
jgi:hypothetical protein